MRCYNMGNILTPAETIGPGQYIIVSNKNDVIDDAEKTGIIIDPETLNTVEHFSKIETQTDYIWGQFFVPRVLDITGKRHELSIFINEKSIVIADSNDYAERLIDRIKLKNGKQAQSKEQFLWNFINQILKNDIIILNEYEKKMFEIEEDIMSDKMTDFQKDMIPLRRELLVLKNYYEQVGEMGKELEENENGLFIKKRLKYFRSVTDKADRLEGKCRQLLDYSSQLRDVHQSQADAKQNNTIEFLTVISTIFFPLTLLTSWYGMNFQDMPELENGYPCVIAAGVIIFAATITIFKIKKLL